MTVVRTRFSPSPTGDLHIGGVWIALFSWIYARKHGGQFLLRIEDTDTKRTIEGTQEKLMASLKWLGINWDEGPDVGGPYGPYVQTERKALYQEWANWLLEHGYAYKCFATPEELAEIRKELEAKGDHSGYDRRYRNTPKEEVEALEAAGKPYVIRFKMPLDGETAVPDLLRGEVVFDNKQFTDYVIMKSNGLPTYHLAHVIDDHFMKISHITRGVEWLNTAPIHIRLFEAFGWEPPIFVHMPVILNPNGKGKLSKRTQAFTETGEEVLVKASEYIEAGYLQDAMINFLSNIGWTFGDDREKFTLDEILERFDLADVSPAPAKLPYSKLDWLNNQYIQELSDEALVELLYPFILKRGLEISPDVLLVLAPVIKMRLKKFTDIFDQIAFLTEEAPLPDSIEAVTHKKMKAEAAAEAYQKTIAYLEGLEDAQFTAEAISDDLRAIGESVTENSKAGPYLGTLRFVVTGQKVSPPLFESMVALGKDQVLKRLRAAQAVAESGE